MAQAMMEQRRGVFEEKKPEHEVLAATPVAVATGTLTGQSATKVAKMLQGTALEFAMVLAMRGL